MPDSNTSRPPLPAGSDKIHCPECGAKLISFMSLRIRQCTNSSCWKTWGWELKEGQQPLIKATR